jgi:hypothetical protein
MRVALAPVLSTAVASPGLKTSAALAASARPAAARMPFGPLIVFARLPVSIWKSFGPLGVVRAVSTTVCATPVRSCS